MRNFVLSSILVGLIAITFAPVASAETRTFKLHQDKPVLTQIDIGARGDSTGDMLAFQAVVHGDNGLNGTVYGLLLTVDVAGGDDKFEDRTGQIYVDLSNGNSIVVAGRSVYQGSSEEMSVGAPQVRAVIGGTGDFIGAAGQVITTRNADGSYDHTVELLK